MQITNRLVMSQRNRRLRFAIHDPQSAMDFDPDYQPAPEDP
jgi:hypothetical protein